jgi:hypothetical protein
MERKNISYFHFSKFFPKKGIPEFSTAVWHFLFVIKRASPKLIILCLAKRDVMRLVFP